MTRQYVSRVGEYAAGVIFSGCGLSMQYAVKDEFLFLAHCQTLNFIKALLRAMRIGVGG